MDGVVVEKHVTLSKDGGGPDDSFSLEPEELKDLCFRLRQTWESLGKVDYGYKSSETGNVKFRRSLYFVEDMSKGQVIEEKHIRSIRPGYGLPPKNFKNVLGKKVVKNIKKGTACKFEDFC